jgi:preprotein translocase subunit Sec61beta
MLDRTPLFAYLGLYKFGKEKSKIKLNRNKIIILVIVFAALVYIANIYISCLI